jgi:hypothetical protein
MASSVSSVTLVLGASLAAGFGANMGKASGIINGLGAVVKKLGATSAQMGATTLQVHKQNGVALAKARASLEKYKSGMDSSREPTEKEAAALELLARDVERAEKAFQKSGEAIDRNRTALDAHGRSVAKTERLAVGLGKIASGSQRAGAAAAGLFSMGKTAALGLAGITASTYMLVNSTAAQGEQQEQQALQLGMTVSSLQAFQFAADRSGLSAEKFTLGVNKMNTSLADAVTKGTGPGAEAVALLGMNLKDLETLPADKRLLAISEAMKGLNAQTRAVAMSKLFGQGNATGFNNLLDGGAAGVKGNLADAQASGAVWDTGNAVAYQNSLTSLTSTLKSLWTTLGAQLLPKFTEFNKTIVSMVSDNRGKITAVIGQLGAMLKRLPAVLGGVLSVVGTLTSVLAENQWLLPAVAVGIGAIGAAIAAVKVASLVSGLVSIAVGLVPVIAGVWAFTAALLANPITWVVVGIGALIGAIVLLWKNWDAVWNGIKWVASGAWELLKTIFAWSPFGLVMRAYGAMFKWLEDKFGIFGKIGGAISKVKGWFGFGKSDESAGAEAGASDSGPAPGADLSKPLTKPGAGVSNRTSNVSISVTQNPGEDGEAFAERVAAKIAERDQFALDNALPAT